MEEVSLSWNDVESMKNRMIGTEQKRIRMSGIELKLEGMSWNDSQ